MRQSKKNLEKRLKGKIKYINDGELIVCPFSKLMPEDLELNGMSFLEWQKIKHKPNFITKDGSIVLNSESNGFDDMFALFLVLVDMPEKELIEWKSLELKDKFNKIGAKDFEDVRMFTSPESQIEFITYLTAPIVLEQRNVRKGFIHKSIKRNRL